MNGDGNLVCFCVTPKRKRLFPKTKEIGATMNKYPILQNEWVSIGDTCYSSFILFFEVTIAKVLCLVADMLLLTFILIIFSVSFMEKWWSLARSLSLIIDLIWMISGHKEKYVCHCLALGPLISELANSQFVVTSVLAVQVVIPLSLQRRVEGLLQEHLDRMLLTSYKVNDELEKSSSCKVVEDVEPYESHDSLVDSSVMEKILQRKSTRMRNLQRTWQVNHHTL